MLDPAEVAAPALEVAVAATLLADESVPDPPAVEEEAKDGWKCIRGSEEGKAKEGRLENRKTRGDSLDATLDAAEFEEVLVELGLVLEPEDPVGPDEMSLESA